MGGFGIMILDMMDTLWLMGLKKEFNQGKEFVANKDGNGLSIPGKRKVLIYLIPKVNTSLIDSEIVNLNLKLIPKVNLM